MPPHQTLSPPRLPLERRAEEGMLKKGNSYTLKLARKTNHIERFNNTLRQRVARLVRDTLSFSKTLANHIGAMKLSSAITT
jgi:IS1 family transposase